MQGVVSAELRAPLELGNCVRPPSLFEVDHAENAVGARAVGIDLEQALRLLDREVVPVCVSIRRSCVFSKGKSERIELTGTLELGHSFVDPAYRLQVEPIGVKGLVIVRA